VGRAYNIALPKDIIGKTMDFVDTLLPEGTASMQRDIMNGRPSELEAQNGAVVRMGQRVGVETPVNAFVCNSLLPMEMRARGQLKFPE
jgi:2-dehydropantoate 2-reductase